MSGTTLLGMAAVLIGIAVVGVLSGRKVRGADDFVKGSGKEGSFLVTGAILGSLAGSQSTIGTAQLAFHFGMSAWWYTLGGGIGCLVLGYGYAKRLRKSGHVTEIQIISEEYGTNVGSVASVLCCIGVFINLLAQILACSGLITTLMPVDQWKAVLFTVAIMGVYVVFGGAWGTSMAGVLKLMLLYLTAIVGMEFVLSASGGASGLMGRLEELLVGTPLGAIQEPATGVGNFYTPEDVSSRYLSLVARGAAKDLGSGVSLLLGVLSTQTYAQGIWCAKSDQAARRGALLSALMAPPLGAAGICVGLYMRANYLLPAEVEALTAMGQAVPELPVLASTIQAFPAFILEHQPPLLAGIMLGTLLAAAAGGGAGLCLGMSTIVVKDMFRKVTRKLDGSEREVAASRATILGILAIGSIATMTIQSKMINDLGFLSMGLRGSVIFVPLTCALVLKRAVDRRFVMAAVVLAPCSVLLWKFVGFSLDPLFAGVSVSLLLCGAGWAVRRRTAETAGTSHTP